MEKKSRFELIKIVEAQKEQLVRYETRLRGKELLQAFQFMLYHSTYVTAGARFVRVHVTYLSLCTVCYSFC